MSDQPVSGSASTTPAAGAASRDFLPGARHAAAHQPPAPWLELSKAECLLWAMALHRAAVAARLAGGESE